MRGKTLSIRLKVALAILAVTLFVTGIAASQERVLGNFRPNSGARPVGGLIFDSAGNLYGTTSQRGLGGNGFGTVFELTPNEGGGWTQKALHNFHDTTDGFSPQGSLVMDTAGNLYGAAAGGVHGYGTVFELTSVGSGRWTFKTLYSFSKNGVDGTYPQTGVILDAAGNLYGTTLSGGTYDSGTVFELTPSPRGSWTEKTLHSFNGVDGAYPTAGLIFDAAGNLYGTTWSSSTHAYGVVFELTPVGGGSWTEIVLHISPAHLAAGWYSKWTGLGLRPCYTPSLGVRTGRIRPGAWCVMRRAISTAPPTTAALLTTAPCSR